MCLMTEGIVSLGTTLNFGNFLPASLTMNLRPFIQQNRDTAAGSLVNRDKGQYRIFFSNGNALYMTVLNGKLLGSMPVQFAHQSVAAWKARRLRAIRLSSLGPQMVLFTGLMLAPVLMVTTFRPTYQFGI
jgi:hypothetical protein